MRRVIVRRSPVHGRGVFARCALSAGERIMEYKGEVIGWRTAARRYQKHGAPGHTYFFGLSDGRVIDGGSRGNSARWFNHACEPNCEAIEMGERVFIHAIAPIGEGQELFLDYRLTLEDDADDKARLHYTCRCGSTDCRGTMLALDASR